MKVIKVKVTGLSALLCHNPAGMQSGAIKGVGAKKIPTPEEEAKAGLYIAADGNFYIHGESFRSSVIGRGGSASGRKIGKRSAISCVSAGFFILTEQAVLLDPKTMKPLRTYEIDSRRAVIQGNGVVRSRPKFPDWATVFTAEVDEDFVTVQIVMELLNIAGKVSGVGDFRPQCKGMFGRYAAELLTK